MKAVVLEGGGILSAAQSPALLGLRTRGIFDEQGTKVFAGTSSGALNALMYAVGMTSEQINSLWATAQEKDMMPRIWYSPYGKRENLLKEFVENKVLLPNHLPLDLTCSQLYDQTGNTFYSVAYVLQENKGIIFGHDWHDIRVSEAVKFGVSHPLKFDPNEYVLNGKTYDLSDGGIFMNCPVLALSNMLGLEQVICVATTNANELSTGGRYTGYFEVMYRIMDNIVVRNQFMCYSIAKNTWGEKFQLYNCIMPEEVDIFDVGKIPLVMEIGDETGIMSDPQNIPSFVTTGRLGFSRNELNKFFL